MTWRPFDWAVVRASYNEGFRAPIEGRVQREQARAQQGGRQPRPDARENNQPSGPAVLIADEDTPSVSAEPPTNSLIVFAGRKDLDPEAMHAEYLARFHRLPLKGFYTLLPGNRP